MRVVENLLRQRSRAAHLALDREIGIALRIRSRARRILRAEGRFEVPKLECDKSATRGVTPKRRTSSAASRAISATCSAFGSAL